MSQDETTICVPRPRLDLTRKKVAHVVTLLPDSPKPTYSAILKRIARWVERLPRAAGLAGWPGTEFRQLLVSSMAIVGYGTSVGSSPLRLRTAGDGSFTNDPDPRPSTLLGSWKLLIPETCCT